MHAAASACRPHGAARSFVFAYRIAAMRSTEKRLPLCNKSHDFKALAPLLGSLSPPGTFCDATQFSSVTLGWRELNPTRFLSVVVLRLIHASLASEFG